MKKWKERKGTQHRPQGTRRKAAPPTREREKATLHKGEGRTTTLLSFTLLSSGFNLTLALSVTLKNEGEAAPTSKKENGSTNPRRRWMAAPRKKEHHTKAASRTRWHLRISSRKQPGRGASELLWESGNRRTQERQVSV